MTTTTMQAFTAPAVPVVTASKRQSRRLARAGSLIVLCALVPIGAWISLAPLSMAVVAPAFVKVDLNRRPVQHLEGGIVRAVYVRDGQLVNLGDPILMLGDVAVDADRNRLAYRISVERAGLVRLEAEQARAGKLVFPPDLVEAAKQDVRIQQALVKETALFQARLGSLTTEVALMRMQRSRVEQESEALRAQIAQIENSYELQRKDMEINRALIKDNFISTARFSQIEAGVSDYAAKIEERRSELARAGQRLGDTDLRIQSAQNAYVQAASDQLKAAASRLAEIDQEMRKSEDAARRQVVAAPASGRIIDLKFNSPGTVVRPGDAIAEIVPTDASLMLEARIRPEEINHVYIDQNARVKFTAFKYRNTAMVIGKVTYISADRLVDRATNEAYFSVMITADADSLHTVGDLKLQAGMPAEVYIEGSKQTTLQYLTEPITSTIRKAARQM